MPTSPRDLAGRTGGSKPTARLSNPRADVGIGPYASGKTLQRIGARSNIFGVPSTPVPGCARSTLGKHRGLSRAALFLRDRLVEVVSESTRNIFPVLDSVDRFQGFVSLEDIRKDMFRTDEYETLHVFNFMRSAEEYVYEDEKMDSVMKKFEVTSAWNLPVVRRDRTYVGFVSKSKIFSAYRDELKVVSQD